MCWFVSSLSIFCSNVDWSVVSSNENSGDIPLNSVHSMLKSTLMNKQKIKVRTPWMPQIMNIPILKSLKIAYNYRLEISTKPYTPCLIQLMDWAHLEPAGEGAGPPLYCYQDLHYFL